MAKKVVKETSSKLVQDVGRVNTWRDIICPASLEFKPDSFSVGDTYGKVYGIYNYPAEVPLEWLRRLNSYEDAIISIHAEKGDPGQLISSIDYTIQEERAKQLGQLDKQAFAQAQESEDHINRALALSQRIKAENANVVNVTSYIVPFAESPEELKTNCQNVTGRLEGNQMVPRNVKYKSEDGLNAIYPIAMNTYKDMIGLDMPSDVFYAGLSFFPPSGITENSGIFLGYDQTKKPILLDIWSKNYNKVNQNLAVLGKSGSGKSATCKTLLIHELSQGTKLFILDAEEEYLSLAKHFKGNVIYAAGEGGSVINPLQLRDFPEAFDEKSDEEIEKMSRSNDFKGSLSTHITFLKGWFKLYQPDMRDVHISLLEDALYETYKKKGITEYSDPRKMKNKEFPIMSDLAAILENRKEDTNLPDFDRKVYSEILVYLKSAISGSDRFQFNGYTNVDLSNKFTVFNVSKLLSSPDNIKNAQFSNITSFIWLALTTNKEEKAILDVDEAHLFINAKSAVCFEFLGNLAKRARKYKSGLWITTQNISDFLHPDVSRYGEGILNNCGTKLLMKSDSTDLQKMSYLFNLNAGEEAMIKTSGRGQGLLIAGDMKVYASVQIEPGVLELCQAGGGS